MGAKHLSLRIKIMHTALFIKTVFIVLKHIHGGTPLRSCLWIIALVRIYWNKSTSTYILEIRRKLSRTYIYKWKGRSIEPTTKQRYLLVIAECCRAWPEIAKMAMRLNATHSHAPKCRRWPWPANSGRRDGLRASLAEPSSARPAYHGCKSRWRGFVVSERPICRPEAEGGHQRQNFAAAMAGAGWENGKSICQSLYRPYWSTYIAVDAGWMAAPPNFL
jgi:hypothetical protein